MNIFKILSSYDGSIKEPNISSFLAYLLDFNEDHGLSDLLLKSILLDFKEVNQNFFHKIKLADLTQSDVTINTGFVYEFPVLKVYALPLLYTIKKDSPYYEDAKRLIRLLEIFLPVPSEHVPNDSILREFIGGSYFK